MCLPAKLSRANWMGHLEPSDPQRLVMGDCRCYTAVVSPTEGLTSSAPPRDTISADWPWGSGQGEQGAGSASGGSSLQKENSQQGALSERIRSERRADSRPCRRRRSPHRRSCRPWSALLGFRLDLGPGPSLSRDLGTPGPGLDLTLPRRETVFTRCPSPGPGARSRQEPPGGARRLSPPGPLPTSPSAVLGPAVLVQLLGVVVVVLVAHGLLTFSILESQRDRERARVTRGTRDTAPNHTRCPLFPPIRTGDSDGRVSDPGSQP